jgi:hypothetical protein
MTKIDTPAVQKRSDTVQRKGSPLAYRLNGHVLQTIRDLAIEIKNDPGIEDEYEYEIFGDVDYASNRKKKTKT